MTAPIAGFDHVSLPLRDADAMAAFYRALGFPVEETPYLVVVRVGDQMINFHRAEMWTRDDFTLRAPAATPPCGDLCFRWDVRPRRCRRALDARRRARSKKARCHAAVRAVSTRRASTCAIPTATCSSS